MPSTTDELQKYELMVIFSGDLPEADFEKDIVELRKLLQENTSGISYEDNWNRRDLAYRIKRQSHGYYVVFNFTASPAVLAEMQTNVKLHPHILRHLLIALPEDYQPGRYKEEKLEFRMKVSEEKKPLPYRPRAPQPLPAATVQPVSVEEKAAPPTMGGKEEEERLKTVEKKLEKILENPDIEVR